MYFYLLYYRRNGFRRVEYLFKKIRIGYVLKSADVGTLFSRRNSENSSHTHAYPRTHQHTPVHTRTHLRTPAHTNKYPRIPVHTRTHPGTPMHTRAYPRTPMHNRAHTCAHPRTPAPTHAHTPNIPTDALNLINHMKLHVNGKI